MIVSVKSLRRACRVFVEDMDEVAGLKVLKENSEISEEGIIPDFEKLTSADFRYFNLYLDDVVIIENEIRSMERRNLIRVCNFKGRHSTIIVIIFSNSFIIS